MLRILHPYRSYESLPFVHTNMSAQWREVRKTSIKLQFHLHCTMRILHPYLKNIPCPCTTFWIFLVYPSTCKNYNTTYRTPIDMIHFALEILWHFLSTPKTSKLLGTKSKRYEFFKLTCSTCSIIQKYKNCCILYSPPL